MTISKCPSCGAQASGNFCNNCGAALGKLSCAKCGSPVRSNARFCANCGTPVPGAAGRTASVVAPSRLPWVLAAVAGATLLVLLIVVLARREPGAQPVAAASAPFAGAGGNGAIPDISQMTPRERFDALYNRIMAAAESGDNATVTRFSPMALQAYDMLDSVDADARYHLALLKVHTGDTRAVAALADTILANQPGHLFGYMIRGAIARFQKDDAGLKKAYADFLAHYDAEMKAGRVEYSEHERSVQSFYEQAKKG